MAPKVKKNPLEKFIPELASQGFAAAASSIKEPWLRQIGQGVNATMPNVIPDITALIQLKHMGLITDGALREAGSRHGIDISGDGAANPYSQLWNGIDLLSYVQFDPDTVQELYRMGLLNDQQYRDKMKLAGFNVPANFRHLSALNREPLPLDALIALMRRGIIDNAAVHADLKRSGVTRENERAGLIQASQYVPGPGDIVQFMLRDVFDPIAVADGKLSDEFADKFTDEAEAMATKQGIDRETMLRYWQSHWSYPSPGELYQMLHRLRPDRIQDVQQLVPGAKAVDLNRVITQLKVQDMAPGWVNEIAAISYSIIGRRDMRLLVKHKEWTEQDVRDGMEDLGYSPKDAKALAHALIIEVKTDDLGSLVTESRSKIFEGIRLGVLTDGQARKLLEQHGMEPDEIDIALQNQKVEMQIADVKAAIAAIKKMRLTGALNRADAENQLLGIGVNHLRVAEFSYEWELELQAGHKQLSAGEVIRMYVEGLLTYEQAYTRLDNVGYRHYDIELLLAEAVHKIQLAQARALLELAKTEEKKRHALVMQAKAAAAEHKAARAELARHGSPDQLVKWYSQGLITEGEAVDRLTALDWPMEDAEHLIRSTELKPAAKQPPPKPAVVPAPVKPKVKVVRQLTEAQIVKAIKDGIVKRDAGHTMLENLGLSVADAEIILKEAGV